MTSLNTSSIMREIKFRGKASIDIDTSGLFNPDESSVKKDDWVYGCDFSLASFFAYVNNGYIDPATVGQWTGLKDCKGVDIYEGDVLQWHNDTTGDSAILTIRWTKYNTCFQMCDDVNRKYFLALSGEGARNSEVIGNIHEVTK